MLKKLILLLFLSIAIQTIVAAQDSLPSLFDAIYDKTDIRLNIRTDMQYLLNKKNDVYIPADITITDGDSLLFHFAGEIRTRGGIRKEICVFSPLKIRVRKEDLKAHNLTTYPTLKIVSTCRYNRQSTDYLIAEYMSYKIYNLLTDRSYRAQMFTLTLIDTEGKRKSFTQPAFFREHEDQMAYRQKGSIYETKYFNEKVLDRMTYHLFSMYQYMIGNTDWMVLNGHNMDIVRVEGENKLYPVPYDFDYAGFVNAHYAIPHSSFPIESVRERYYRGACMTHQEFTTVKDTFFKKRQAIVQTVKSISVAPSNEESYIKYLEDFYAELDNEKFANSTFINCN